MIAVPYKILANVIFVYWQTATPSKHVSTPTADKGRFLYVLIIMEPCRWGTVIWRLSGRRKSTRYKPNSSTESEIPSRPPAWWQRNMCASHLVCMLTVISTRAHTVFPGLSLLFGQLLEEAGFSCTSEESTTSRVAAGVQTRGPQAASAAKACWAAVAQCLCRQSLTQLNSASKRLHWVTFSFITTTLWLTLIQSQTHCCGIAHSLMAIIGGM